MADKLNVITAEWVGDYEIHLYVPGERTAWWAKRLDKLGGGALWELRDDLDETEGYYATPEDACQAVSEKFGDAPVVVTKEREE